MQIFYLGAQYSVLANLKVLVDLLIEVWGHEMLPFRPQYSSH